MTKRSDRPQYAAKRDHIALAGMLLVLATAAYLAGATPQPSCRQAPDFTPSRYPYGVLAVMQADGTCDLMPIPAPPPERTTK